MTNDQEDAHSKKIQFLTRDEAQAAATVARNIYDTQTRLKTYRCRQCENWHISTNYQGDQMKYVFNNPPEDQDGAAA